MGFQERMAKVLDELADKGISASDVAVVIGKTKGTPSGWRSGGIKSISYVEALKMQRAYGYRLHWLITGEGPKYVTSDERMDPTLLLSAPERELLELFSTMQAFDKNDRRETEVLFNTYRREVHRRAAKGATAHSHPVKEVPHRSEPPRSPGRRKRRTK